MRYHPHKYQTYAAEFIKDRNAAGLFLEMGLGKTVITLTALSDLIKAGQARRILVIAPLRVAQTVWRGGCEVGPSAAPEDIQGSGHV